MTKRSDKADMTEVDYARAADEAFEHRDEIDSLEEVEFEVDADVRSVVSVRFNRGELAQIEQAAIAAGMPVSTYIRNAALATSATIDLDAARAALAASQRTLKEAMNALSSRPNRKPAA